MEVRERERDLAKKDGTKRNSQLKEIEKFRTKRAF